MIIFHFKEDVGPLLKKRSFPYMKDSYFYNGEMARLWKKKQICNWTLTYNTKINYRSPLAVYMFKNNFNV